MRNEFLTDKKNSSMYNKGKNILKIIPLTIAGIFVFSSAKISAQDGEALFKQTCGACHTIGGGKVVGPDLKGVTTKRSEDWLMKWTKSSQTLINSGDADAKKIFEEFNKIPMPDQNLKDGEIKAVYAYISKQSGGTEVATIQTPTTPVISSDKASDEQIALGQALFERGIFTNGGTACISCHNVNSKRVIPGGLLAKDLTTSFSRMGGDAGITGILNAPPFPAMTEAYKNRPMTPKEIAAIAAFLNTVEKENATQPQAEAANPLIVWGFAGLMAWVILVLVIWMKRKKNTVKLDIYERQVKSY